MGCRMGCRSSCRRPRSSGCSTGRGNAPSPRRRRGSASASVSRAWRRSASRRSPAASGPKMFQLYDHKDQGLNRYDQRCKAEIRCPGVHRRYDRRGQARALPPHRLHLAAADHPGICAACGQAALGAQLPAAREVRAPRSRGHVPEGRTPASIAGYFSQMLDQGSTGRWPRRCARTGRQFCLKGSWRSATRAARSRSARRDHGLQPRRPPARRQPRALRPAARDRRRGRRRDRDHLRRRHPSGSHVLKALASGRSASGGRLYLYALAAAGQGRRARPAIIKDEIEREMKLMGVTSIKPAEPR